jgi:hypothetical protein
MSFKNPNKLKKEKNKRVTFPHKRDTETAPTGKSKKK